MTMGDADLCPQVLDLMDQHCKELNASENYTFGMFGTSGVPPPAGWSRLPLQDGYIFDKWVGGFHFINIYMCPTQQVILIVCFHKSLVKDTQKPIEELPFKIATVVIPENTTPDERLENPVIDELLSIPFWLQLLGPCTPLYQSLLIPQGFGILEHVPTIIAVSTRLAVLFGDKYVDNIAYRDDLQRAVMILKTHFDHTRSIYVEEIVTNDNKKISSNIALDTLLTGIFDGRNPITEPYLVHYTRAGAQLLRHTFGSVVSQTDNPWMNALEASHLLPRPSSSTYSVKLMTPCETQLRLLSILNGFEDALRNTVLMKLIFDNITMLFTEGVRTTHVTFSLFMRSATHDQDGQ